MEYGFVNRADNGNGNARYDQFVDHEPSRSATAFRTERPRFASSRGGGNETSNQYHESPYQPPSQNINEEKRPPSENINKEMHNQKQREEIVPDYLTNDHAFFVLASSALSGMERIGGDDMDYDEREKSIAITLMLQRTLSLLQMKRFHEALDIRVKCMPKYPSDGESHLCTIVRRCNGMFGIELKALLRLTKGESESNHDRRDDEPRGQGPKPWHNRRGPEDDSAFSSLPVTGSHSHSHSQSQSSFQKVETRNDLTDHIVWDNDLGKRMHIPKKTSNDTDSTAQMSQFNDGESEVYDMIVEDQGGKANTFEGYNSSGDNDDKSVASLYSISRTKALDSPPPNNRKIVRVKAPETLPGNFMFEARMNDDIFMVYVPKGGVKKGEIFKSPALSMASECLHDPTGRVKRLVDMNSPSEHWRDGLFEIFANGPFHPMCLTSLFCTHVALAQVMARMHLDNSGNKTTSLRSRVNFNIVRLVPMVLFLLNGVFFLLAYRAFHFHLEGQIWVFLYSSIPVLIADVFMYGYFVYMTAKVRRIIRQEYNIDHYNCLGLQDEVLALCCAPLVVAQMGRHTADYDTYVGMCCIKTGLSDHIEVKLPGDLNNDNVVGFAV